MTILFMGELEEERRKNLKEEIDELELRIKEAKTTKRRDQIEEPTTLIFFRKGILDTLRGKQGKLLYKERGEKAIEIDNNPVTIRYVERGTVMEGSKKEAEKFTKESIGDKELYSSPFPSKASLYPVPDSWGT